MRMTIASDAGTRFAAGRIGAAVLLTAALLVRPVSADPGASAPAAASNGAKAEIGKPAPDFTLKDTEGREHRLSDYTKAGKTVVLEWFNPDCPYSQKHHVRFHTMTDLASELEKKNVVWLAVNSGAPGKQGAGLERNRKAKADYSMSYPILLDQSGKVGRAYGAKTTPHMFVIAPDGALIYKGAIDDDRRPQTMGSTVYVRTAIDAYASGGKVDPAETMSYGCSVKYAD